MFNPGSILINTSNNKLYGTLVTTLPNNKIIVFRLDKNTHPIFSKFEIHPHISKIGIINEHQFSSLKSALLKHYRTYNLTPTEKKMLTPLMNFAFPLGIPEYQPGCELPERDIALMDLHSKMCTGARMFINTHNKSCYQHLDGKIVDVIEKTDNGIWVNLPNGETDVNKINNSMYFIFYKNREIPTFGGISRVMPIIENENIIPKLSDILLEGFKQLKANDNLITTMEYNGDKVRVIPKSGKIIFPEIYQNMIYNPNTDSFTIDPALVSSSLASKLGNKLVIGSKDSRGNIITMNTADNELTFGNGDGNLPLGSTCDKYEVDKKIDENGDIIYSGGSRETIDINELENIQNEENSMNNYFANSDSSIFGNIDDLLDPDINPNVSENSNHINDITKTSQFLEDDENDINDLLLGIMPQKTKKYNDIMQDGNKQDANIEDNAVIDINGRIDIETDVETDVETNYDEEEVIEIVEEDQIEDLGTFEKIKRVEVDEMEKVYKESIQQGDLYKYKIEQIPVLRRTEEVKMEIRKQINIISLLKHSITNKDDNSIVFKPHDYKPLVSRYIKGDFTNKFLIPLVINKKKIYLDKSKKGLKDEYDSLTNIPIEDYYENIQRLIHLQDKKNISVHNDTYTNNIINEMNPTTVYENEELGVLFRLGNEMDNTDYKILSQDTLTIKYCDKPFKCQSYALTTMNFDYQINLGPIGRFIDEEEDDLNKDVNLDDEEEKHDKNILYTTPKFKLYYQGDVINIIGYVRPPLKYFNLSDETILSHLYEARNKKHEVVTINLEDINLEVINEELEEQFNITQNPDKFILFLLPHGNFEWKNLEHEIQKIIPSIDEIISLYINKPQQANLDNIYSILNKFNYDYMDININNYRQIIAQHEKLADIYREFDNKIKRKYSSYLDKVKKEIADDEITQKENANKPNNHFKYITNEIMEDISKFYFETYENKGISIDADDIRLKWFMKSFDNGRYLFKSLFMNYLKTYQETRKLENLETELAILKEKHAFMVNNLQLQQQSQQQSQSSIDTTCSSKLTGPNIIKYPNLERLEKDNGKVATDSDGNVIMVGDYALVDVNGSKQLFKREIIGNIDMWIKENLEVLYKLIMDKKNKCLSNPEMKLEDAHKCLFDSDKIKCEPHELFEVTKENVALERTVNDLQQEIEYIKHIPVLISELTREITNDRIVLVNRLNSLKRFWKNKENEEKELEQLIKNTIFRPKQCVHFEVTDYFFKLKGYDSDRYQFAQSILKNFQNTDPEFINDYSKFNGDNRAENYSYCNICAQELLCNHFRLGISYIEESKLIDFEHIITVFSDEVDGGYVCKACNELLGTTDVLDLDDFAKGDDGARIKTRELAENTPFIEKQKLYINNMIDDLINGVQTVNTEELRIRINIYKLLKHLVGIENLIMKDEIDMINFIKSFTFVSKNIILAQLAAKLGTGNLQLLKKQVDKFYLIYLVCDIAARLLIILQTSSTTYVVSNKSCIPNIIGYPLINDIDATNGINFIMCLIEQMVNIPEYSALADAQTKNLVERLKKQVEDDNYVKNKIYDALTNKSNEIDMMYSFETYYTNNWKTFTPRLHHININWSPEKILNSANLKELSVTTYNRILDVGRENCVFYSLNIIDSINHIIEKSDKSNNKGLSNYCCADSFNSTKQYDYMNFFTERDPNIIKNINNFNEINDILHKIDAKLRFPIYNIIYEPIYKPSQKFFSLDFTVTEDEIRNIYLKFIDSGLNKGKLHIYDKYGRCILSNEQKSDIEIKTYSQQDYKRIKDAINSGNQINITKYFKDDVSIIDIEQLEIVKLKELIDNCPKIDIMTFINNYLETIKENIGTIFNIENITNKKHYHDDKEHKFDIYRHLSTLNSQIQVEINNLVKKITTTDKNIDKYTKILSDLGYFYNLYQEYKENNEKMGQDNNTINDLFRYNKKEEHIQYTIKLLNDIINQIKNNRLSKPLDKESIRPQFREFLQYGENAGLFKTLSISSIQIYEFAKQLKSKHKYKILFPEMVSSILQYLNIISLVNLFDVLDNNKIAKNKSEIVDYNFKVIKPPADDLIDFNKDANLSLEEEGIIDYDDNPIDFIESFEIKNSDNLKTIGGFIISYLDRIDDIQSTYDELTDTHINLVITKYEQTRIESNLRVFEWLSAQGRESERQLLMLQLNKLKKITYGGLKQHLVQEYGENFWIEDEENEDNADALIGDDEDLNEDNERYNNELGLDKYELGEMGDVFDAEENEDGDQDYDYMAVDNDD
jgi:hypothetical protein